MSSDELSTTPEYRAWVVDLKARFRSGQLKAAVSVNTELLRFYWELGSDIVARQGDHAWGTGFIKQLAHDLRTEFPDVKGFSAANLAAIRQWVTFWNAAPTLQQPVGKFGQQTATPIVQQPGGQLLDVVPQSLLTIPWGHNLAILAKCKDAEQAWFYVQATIEHGWSRTSLVHQIETNLWRRQGAASTNFSAVLPPAESALAMQVLKDPYVFDFLSVSAEHDERELERDLLLTSPSSSWSWAPGSPSSGDRCRSRSTTATSSSTCSLPCALTLLRGRGTEDGRLPTRGRRQAQLLFDRRRRTPPH